MYVGRAEGLSVGLMEQPYRVAGRRSPAPAGQLDAAWLAVVSRLRERELVGLPLLVGGRSLGARAIPEHWPSREDRRPSRT